MDAAQAKRNRLPFKAPRRQSEGTNSSTTTNKTASKTTSRKPPSTSTASASKSIAKTKATAAKASSSKAKSTTFKTPSTSNPRKRKAQSISSDSEDSNASIPSRDSDNEDGGSRSRSTSPFTEPDYILAEIVTNNKSRNIESDEPGIPLKLLTTILHHHFRNKKTKITKDANEVVAKYMDIFVREALARAAFERADAASKDGGGRYAGDGFLEVEDLEKLVPQMLLDF